MRDPKNDAFFTAESLENLSEALVREGIQNSLDAGRRENSRVRNIRVRIKYVPNASTEICNFLRTQFNSAARNFEKGLGAENIDNLFDESCGYLLFEDFGTRGLTGEIQEWRLDKAKQTQNSFFSFFRGEGWSPKSGESLGRWGIGKQVFPTASRLHAIFGLTVRNESPARVLMGTAVVRTHSVGDQDYQPDGWFGYRDDADSAVEPITDADTIESFVAAFGLERTEQNGLSIIVPSTDDRVNALDLRRGVIRSFFWPILNGELVVQLETPDGNWVLDPETLATHRELLSPNEVALIEFANWASTAKPAEIVVLDHDAATRPDWRSTIEKLLPESKLEEIRKRLATQQRVGVKVPVRVRPKDGDGIDRMSFFTVYIGTCRENGNRALFLRDGIVITDIRCPQITGTRSLVVIDDPALASLLGDAEGVNHTQWQKDSPKFHNRYVYGGDTIKFVTRSVYEIIQRLHAGETKGDPALLLDIFSLPTDEGQIEKATKPKRKEPGTVVDPPGEIPPPRPKRWEVNAIRGGFMLSNAKSSLPLGNLPIKIRIKAGYDVRRGDAINRWSADDFNFIRLPLHQDEAKGIIVTRFEKNILELEIRKPEFQYQISGFDTKRDLVVRATELKVTDETDV